MKSMMCALTILFSVIIATVLVSIYTDELLTDFIDVIDDIPGDSESISAYADEVEQKYKNTRLFFILFMRENDVKETEMYIEDMITAAQENDKTALMEAKSRLRLHTQRLKRLSAFSIEAIF